MTINTKITTVEPQSEGQFAAVWIYNDNIWSGVYRRDDKGNLFIYDMEYDDWVLTREVIPSRARLLAFHVITNDDADKKV